MGALRLRARVRAPVGQVRQALTEERALRVWLAEHAEVDLPHSFAFWGRYTPWGEMPRQRVLHIDERLLRFGWCVDDVETTVEFSLADDGPSGTIVDLTQTHVPDWGDVVAEKGPRCVLATFWSLAVANLVDFVEGRELTPKCDFTSPRLAAHVLIAAAPDEVFDSLVDPVKIARWFVPDVEVELREGGRWAMDGAATDRSIAKIVELDPGRRLDLDWGSFVSHWELEGSEGRTRLTFVHSGFDSGDPPYAGWLGWLSAVSELRRFHEVGGEPVWLLSQLPGLPGGTA